MDAQGQLLSEIAALVDAGALKTTVTRKFGPMSPETLRNAHAEVETGSMIGKLVLEEILRG